MRSTSSRSIRRWWKPFWRARRGTLLRGLGEIGAVGHVDADVLEIVRVELDQIDDAGAVAVARRVVDTLAERRDFRKAIRPADADHAVRVLAHALEVLLLRRAAQAEELASPIAQELRQEVRA